MATPFDSPSGTVAPRAAPHPGHDRAGLRSNEPVPRPDLVVCDGCHAVYRRVPLKGGDIASCARCGAMLGRGHTLPHEGQLALALGALVVFLIANLTPIVELSLGGSRTTATLMQSIRATWTGGREAIAAITFATAWLFPLLVILLRLYVLAPLSAGWRPPHFKLAMRLLRVANRWAMVEVFMLGTLIALVRSATVAHAELGPGIFAFGALAVLLTADQAAGLHSIWHRATELQR